MKYFTQDWCDSKLSDSSIEKIQEKYWKYIESVFREFPYTIKILSRWVCFHDGFVKNININKRAKTIKMNCLLGDLQSGYFLLSAKYSEADLLSDFSIKSLDNNNIEVLSNEFELLSNEKYSHKILFSNRKEIEITFSKVVFSIQDITSRVQYKCKVKTQ